MKTHQDKREKAKLKKLKLKARKMWILYDAPPETEKISKWEFELFKRIAEERCGDRWFVIAKHILPNWNTGWKTINKENLTVSNMSHKIPKSRWEEYRLDPDNIEIVSMAYHLYEHTRQILQPDVPN